MQFRQLVATGFGLIYASLASTALAQEPAAPAAPPAAVAPPPPAADVPPPGARTTHIVAGAATTVVSYGLALGASFLFDQRDFNGSRDLRVPFAGPWMALSKAGCPESNSDCSPVGVVLGAIFLIADGVSQAGGLAIIGEGLFLKTSPSPSRRAKEAEGPTVHAVPVQLGKSGAGIGFVGTF